MQTRRFLTFLAAVLITLGQALIFAADTAASAQGAVPAIAGVVQAHASSSEV